MRRIRNDWLVVAGCCVFLLLLWLPHLQYPIVSDTATYAVLGEQLWKHGSYTLFGEPYAKHLPFHAFLSYPFVWVLGYGLGMKVSSLLAGWGVLVSTYLLLRRALSPKVALIAVVLLTVHHGFTYMTTLGSADLLFTVLFLLSSFFYLRADQERQCSVSAFVLAGLASLTRYNGLPLFALFLGHALLFRREILRSGIYWVSVAAGASLPAAWFVRNFLVFGDPLYTEYTAELSKESLGFFSQVASNAVFYLHPLRNLLPLLLLCAAYGLWKHGRRQGFLLAMMLTAWLLTSFWWVRGMRFAFPGYPILMGFAVLGLLDALRWFRSPLLAGTVAVALILPMHVSALCMYSYGLCNAWFDRNVGGFPPDLGLSSEGFYTWDRARDYVNEHAPPHAYVDAGSLLLARVWQRGVFRDDLRVVGSKEDACPVYRITAEREGGEVLYSTEDAPVRYVHLLRCDAGAANGRRL